MIYHFGECTLDTELYCVQRGGQTIRLRPKVFRMCLYLLEHRNRVVSREELCAQMWPGRFVNPATLEGVIRSVRQALGDSGRAQGIIMTRHSYGYRFVAPVDECPPKSMVKSVSLAAVHRAPPEASGLGQTGDEMTSAALAQEPEARFDPGSPDEIRWGVAGRNRPSARRRVAVVLGEWTALVRRSYLGWRVASVGLALALVLLGLVGGWALWREFGEQARVMLDRSRIAVLPFTDLSSGSNQATFADGITRELIAQLAQIHGLTVIARTSASESKGTLKDVTSIGRELQAGTVLEGRVRAVDNQLWINAELIDVASQSRLWSQEYERELTEVIRSQSDIATRVVQDLKVERLVGDKHPAGLPSLAQHASF